MNSKSIATVYAILAAALYAINVPLSKVLLNYVEPTMMASFLYLGAGIGLFLFGIVEKLIGKGGKKEPLTKKELPYTIAMVILDIVAQFLGVALSMILLKEHPSLQFFVALIIMIFSTVLMVKDTIELQHTHEHRHGDLVHTHLHTHSGDSEEHGHEYLALMKKFVF